MPPEGRRADIPGNRLVAGSHRNKTSFKAGKSGNPFGRPKALIEVRDLARKQTAKAIEALVDIMTAGKSEPARVNAAQALLDRGWGKPTQAIEATEDTTVRIVGGFPEGNLPEIPTPHSVNGVQSYELEETLPDKAPQKTNAGN